MLENQTTLATTTEEGIVVLNIDSLTGSSANLIDPLSDGGTIVLNGTVRTRSTGSNGINVPAGVTLVAHSGGLEERSGRPSFSGDGNIILSEAFAYDAAASTATQLTRTAATSSILVNTTIDTLSSQTQFALKSGPPDNDALNGALVVVTDSTNSLQKAVGIVLDYIGSSRTVTLASDPGIYNMAAGDKVDVIALKP